MVDVWFTFASLLGPDRQRTAQEARLVDGTKCWPPPCSGVVLPEYFEIFVGSCYRINILLSDRIERRVLSETVVNAHRNGIDRGAVGEVDVEPCRGGLGLVPSLTWGICDRKPRLTLKKGAGVGVSRNQCKSH